MIVPQYCECTKELIVPQCDGYAKAFTGPPLGVRAVHAQLGRSTVTLFTRHCPPHLVHVSIVLPAPCTG